MYELNFKKTTNRYSKEDLLQNIKAVWDFKKSQPTINDMSIFPSEINFHTYFNRFGSWKNALKEFVEYNNNGIAKDKIEILPQRKSRKTINNSLRYEIMKRDSFKCCICGKSPANEIGVMLEIDHIIAVTKGGDNSIENLQTICKNCNIGKLNK